MPYWRRLLQRHEEKLITSIVDFQKAQCYFSIALQVASVASGSLVSTSMLDPNLLVPLSTNAILPLTLNLLVIHHFGRTSIYLSALTFFSWLIASIVFWHLYTWTFIPLYWNYTLNDDPIVSFFGHWDASTSLEASLGALPACGQHSAREICGGTSPDPAYYELNPPMKALSWTPLIWVFCTLYLVAIYFEQIGRARKGFALRYRAILNLFNVCIPSWLSIKLRKYLNKWKLSSDSIFQLTIISFLCLFGFQFYLFSNNVALGLVDTSSWGFGQIVAVFAWVPPMVEYVYLLFGESSYCRR